MNKHNFSVRYLLKSLKLNFYQVEVAFKDIFIRFGFLNIVEKQKCVFLCSSLTEEINAILKT